MAHDADKPPSDASYDAAYYRTLAAEAEADSLSHRWRMRWLEAMLPVEAGDHALDLGSGAGSISRRLAERGATVEGVDLSEEAVRVARQRCQGLPVRFTVADAAHCDHLESASFDKAACCDLIEHVDDATMGGVFDEAYRLLKPGGLFYVYSPNRDHWIERLKHRQLLLKNPVSHIAVRRIVEVVSALEAKGFEIARLVRPPSFLPVVRWLERIWIRLPVCPTLGIYRVCVLARKPSA